MNLVGSAGGRTPLRRSGDPARGPGIHLMEPGGFGGPYQHVVALAEVLADQGLSVVVHTASDPECLPAVPVRVCRCTSWFREVRPRGARGALFTAAYLGRTVPHLMASTRPGDVVHFHGTFKMALTHLTLTAARLLSRRVVFSPHNTFARNGRAWEDRWLRSSTRNAATVMVYSDADAERVRAWGGRPLVAELVQHMPLDPAMVSRWRDSWRLRPGQRVVLFAGRIREDKRLDLLVAAAARWRSGHLLAVVGEDEGGLAAARALAADAGVEVRWHVKRVAVGEFVAALAAADIVVCPHERASQSGVLALSRQLGTRTVARNVGGLAELAGTAVEGDDPSHLAGAIDAALEAPAPQPAGIDQSGELVGLLCEAYGLGGGVTGIRGARENGPAP